MKKLTLFLIIAGGLLSWSESCGQATYQTHQIGAWNLPATWTYVSGTPVGTQPLATDNVIINHNVSIPANTTVNNITTNGTNNVSISANNVTLTVNGTMTMNGTSGFVGGSITRTLSLHGDFIVPAGQNPNFLQIIVSQTSTRSFTVNGTFGGGTAGYTMSLGNVVVGSTGTWQPIALVVVSAGSLTITDGGTIDNFNITGGFTVSGAFNIDPGAAGAISTLGDCLLTIAGPTSIAGTLYFSKTASGAKNFNGTITNYVHGEFRNSLGESLNLNCSIVNNSLWAAPIANNGTYTVNAAGNYTYSGTNVIGMSQLSITAAATVTNQGSLALSNATGAGLVVNNATGSFVNGNGGYLQILSPGTGVTLTSGTINFSTPSNQVDYSLAGAQNIYTTTYDQLTASNSGTKSLVGAIVVNTLLTTSSSAILDAGTNTLNGSGSITMTGTSQISFAKTAVNLPELTGSPNSFALGTTIRLYGTAVQTLKPSATFPYQNLLINGTAGCSANLSNVGNVAGNLTISSAAVVTSNPAMIIGGTTTYSSTGSSTIANNLTTGSFLISGGTLNYSGITITINGNSGAWTTNGGTLTTDGLSAVTFTTGTGQQIGGTSSPFFPNLAINNPNDVTLTATPTVSVSLTLTSGRVLTGNNSLIVGSAASVSRTSGFVEGNLQKNVNTCGVCSPVLFEVGTTTTYAPLQLNLSAVSVSGSLTASTIAGDDPNIGSSLINSAKSVNRYWTLSNTGMTLTYTPQFTYGAGDVDGAATPANFDYSQFDPSTTTWITPVTPSGVPTSTGFLASTSTTSPASGGSRQFQIGESLAIPPSVLTRVTGTPNWSSATTWIQTRTGTLHYTNGSTNVTGTGGTLFSSELAINDVLVLQTSPGTVIGTVQSITGNTILTLAANVTVATGTGTYGREHVPISSDAVQVGNTNVAGATNVQLDVAGACYSLTISAQNTAQTLTHVASNTLTVGSSVAINAPGNNTVTNAWNINAGSASATALTIGNGTGSAANARIAKTVLTTGTLTILNNITLSSSANNGAETTTVLDMTGGAGQLNLGGAFNFTNSRGLLSPGTTSIVNFNSSSATQAISFPASNQVATPWVYNIIEGNNISTGGLTLTLTNLTTTNLTGDLRIQSGTLTSNSTITGGAAKTFQISPGATFIANGGTTGLSGFGTFDFGTTAPFGTFNYSVTNGVTSLSQPYGNLTFGSSQFFTLPAGSTTAAGTLTISAAATMAGTAPGSAITAGRDVLISSGSGINAGNITSISVGGNWNDNGTFAASSSTVVFTGLGVSQPQIISGSTSETFNNLQINTLATTNTAQLQKNISVSNILTLSQGGLDLNGHVLSITSSSTSAIARTSGYIRSETSGTPYAPVTWTTNAATGSYVFPFGKSSTEYIPFTFNITGGGANFGSSVSVATYGTVPANTPYPNTVTNVNAGGVDNSANVVDRFWIITPNSYTTNPTATMTFTATSGEVGTIVNLIAQYWSPGNFWNPSYPGQTNTAASATVPGIFNFGVWTMSGNNVPLPIELVSVNAVVQNQSVLVSWITASEINNDYFTVERSSDGIHFLPIARIKGQGTKTSETHYSYVDDSPFVGRSYYRLSQTDFDGRSSDSEIISVEFDSGFQIYPIPIMDRRCHLIIPESWVGESRVTLTDLNGRVVAGFVFNGTQNSRELIFDSGFAAGMYILMVENGIHRSVRKVLFQ